MVTPMSSDTPLDDLSFKVRDDLVVESIDGECLVLDLDRNVYFGLNALGVIVWGALETGSALPELLDALSERFPRVPRPDLDADLRAFLRSLLDADLVRAADR